MKIFHYRRTRPMHQAALGCLLCLFGLAERSLAFDKINLAVPVVAVQYMPIYFGLKERVFAGEELAMEIHVMRTDLAIAGLDTAKLDYIAHGGAALRGATRGFPLKDAGGRVAANEEIAATAVEDQAAPGRKWRSCCASDWPSVYAKNDGRNVRCLVNTIRRVTECTDCSRLRRRCWQARA